MPGFDRIAIAARIRGLLSGQDGGDPVAAAARLGVDEVGLRMSIDDLAPNPTIEVIGSIVRAYGVDPMWLLTGEYDPGLHRHLLEERQPVEQTISRLMQAVTFAAPAGNTLRLMRE